MTEKFKIHLYLKEVSYDLDVPIQVEIEYGLEGKNVCLSSLSRKVRYNRPLLIKEAHNHSVEELDRIIHLEVQQAIQRHLSLKGYIVDDE